MVTIKASVFKIKITVNLLMMISRHLSYHDKLNIYHIGSKELIIYKKKCAIKEAR